MERTAKYIFMYEDDFFALEADNIRGGRRFSESLDIDGFLMSKSECKI